MKKKLSITTMKWILIATCLVIGAGNVWVAGRTMRGQTHVLPHKNEIRVPDHSLERPDVMDTLKEDTGINNLKK